MSLEDAENAFYKIWIRVYKIKNPENKPKIRKKKYTELMTEKECSELHKLFQKLGYSDKRYSRKLREQNSKLCIKHTSIREAREMLTLNRPVPPTNETREILIKQNAEKNKVRKILTEHFGKTHESSHVLVKKLVDDKTKLEKRVELLEEIVRRGIKRGLELQGAEMPVQKKVKIQPDSPDLHSIVPSFYTSQSTFPVSYTTEPDFSTSFNPNNQYTSEVSAGESAGESEGESEDEYGYDY